MSFTDQQQCQALGSARSRILATVVFLKLQQPITMGFRKQLFPRTAMNYKTVLVFLLHFVVKCILAERSFLNLTMPDVRPTHDESYLCVSHRINPTEHEFIVGFQPNASAKKVHHILIYGCSLPGRLERDTPKYVWECGEMNLLPGSEDAESPYDQGPTCATGGKTTILFGWALDAPAIELPSQVGFKIGGDSGIDYLVLQVHYGNTTIFRSNEDITDNSASYGYVIKGPSRHSIECSLNEEKVIHPFRFRTHTHKLGTKVAGFKKSADNSYEPELIGEHNPQEPQMFYPIEDESMTISKGDRIYAYCDYNNTKNHEVIIGPTGNDEMCNFYIMYWTEGKELLQSQDCVQFNPS